MKARYFPLALALLCCATPVIASYAVYKGTIGSEQVTVFLSDKNAVVGGVYFYDEHRTPIRLKPAITHSLEGGIDELDADGIPIGRLTLTFNAAAFNGHWTSYRTGRTLPLRLSRVAYSAYGAEDVPILQAASTNRFYFIVPSVATGTVRAIEVHDKATGALVQTLTSPSPMCANGIDTITMVGQTRIVIAGGTGCSSAAFTFDPLRNMFVRAAGAR
jgi:hypothetical protein